MKKMLDVNEQELGFRIPETCETYSFRLHPSIVEEAEALLGGASKAMLVDNLLMRWCASVKARRAERERREAMAEKEQAAAPAESAVPAVLPVPDLAPKDGG